MGDEPVFDSGLLLAGDIDPDNVRRQLSRWTSTGRLYQMRRGLYSLAPPYQVTKPHPFLVANRMVSGSYVSLQSALAYYNLIPEYVPIVLSVTSDRPNTWETPLGKFGYRHIKSSYLHGYRLQPLDRNHSAFIALPEKALLDLVYLTPAGDEFDYLRSLRLQNLEQLELARLDEMTAIFDRPKIARAAQAIRVLRAEEIESTETL